RTSGTSGIKNTGKNPKSQPAPAFGQVFPELQIARKTRKDGAVVVFDMDADVGELLVHHSCSC
ncbi:hypothetical protein NP202_23870, partial [Salmonella enterica]|nr:hypothetical protein [Salmonella enterica]